MSTSIATTNNNIDHIVLKEITIVNASFNNKSNLTVLPTDVDYDFDFTIQPSANLVEKWLKFVFSCTVNVCRKDKNKLDIASNFEIAYIFIVDNLDQIAKELPNNQIQVPQDVLDSLYNITYSTSRGIIYTRCLGTIMKNVIIPVVSTPKLRGRQ